VAKRERLHGRVVGRRRKREGRNVVEVKKGETKGRTVQRKINISMNNILMFHFCKHKDMLGKPKTGVHSYRIMNIAIVDVLGTILLAKAIQYYIIPETNIWLILSGCFLSGIILHRIFCVKTTIDKFLFGR